MTNISETIKQILCEGEGGQLLSGAFDHSLVQRLKVSLYSLAEKLGRFQYKRLRNWLTGVEVFVGILGAAGGFYLTYSNVSDVTKAVAWAVYILVAAMIITTVRMLPQEIEQFDLEARNLMLTILAERLAANVALFDLLAPNDSIDDKEIIISLSDFLPEACEFDVTSQNVITRCLEPHAPFNNPRETNIRIRPDRLSETQKHNLQEIAQQIVMLSGHLFAGRDFTAKVFLRTEKVFNDSKVEILTSFAKFPTRGTDIFGSSWVKARGNPSAVWTSLELGKPVVKSATEHNKNYVNVLAICLPGRIGVLSLTSTQNNAFSGFDEEWTTTTRSLAAATTQLALSALGLKR